LEERAVSQSKITLPGGSVVRAQQDEIFMRYLPEAELVVCGCGKCGSTSMYLMLYKAVLGKEWNFKGRPYPQNILSDRWEKHFVKKNNVTMQEDIMKSSFSFALIRDPKERLISAWKSKISCETEVWGTDTADRARLVPFLLRMADMESNADFNNMTCFDFPDFMKVLHVIHVKGRARYLDNHFLPQDLGCFDRFPPERWSKIATISDVGAFLELGESLGNVTEVPAHDHISGNETDFIVSPEAGVLLEKVTKQEYVMLSPFLPKTSIVGGSQGDESTPN